MSAAATPTPLAERITALALAYVGTPFHHQGRLPGVGLDCAGVPICIARSLGLVDADFDVTGYAPQPDGVTLQALCDAHLQRIDALEPGAVVLVAWRDGPPQHLGVIVPQPIDGDFMVHAESRRHRRVMITRVQFGRAMRRVGVYRLGATWRS